jgi:hypothetical protein
MGEFMGLISKNPVNLEFTGFFVNYSRCILMLIIPTLFVSLFFNIRSYLYLAFYFFYISSRQGPDLSKMDICTISKDRFNTRRLQKQE